MEFSISGRKVIACAPGRGIGCCRAFPRPAHAAGMAGRNFLVDGGAYISAF